MVSFENLEVQFLEPNLGHVMGATKRKLTFESHFKVSYLEPCKLGSRIQHENVRKVTH